MTIKAIRETQISDIVSVYSCLIAESNQQLNNRHGIPNG